MTELEIHQLMSLSIYISFHGKQLACDDHIIWHVLINIKLHDRAESNCALVWHQADYFPLYGGLFLGI